MHRQPIGFRPPQGWNLKKIGHKLEMNASELVIAALREYLQRRGIELP